MPEPRGPLMSPGFWLHHAALEWRQRLDRAYFHRVARVLVQQEAVKVLVQTMGEIADAACHSGPPAAVWGMR